MRPTPDKPVKLPDPNEGSDVPGISPKPAAAPTLEQALTLCADLIAYSRLRDKVRLREDPTEYVEAERLLARFDALRGDDE